MRLISLILSFLVFALPAGAAEDFQVWTEAGVRVRLAKGWRLKFDQHVRFDESYHRQNGDTELFHSMHSIIPEVAISYRALRFLRLEAGCRFIQELRESKQDTFGEPWGRVFASVLLRYRLRPVTIRYRLQYDEQYGEPWNNEENPVWRHTVRNKIGVEVKLAGGFVPFLSGELFLRIDDPDGVPHKWRATAGLDWEIDPHVVTLFYRLEDMLDDDGVPNRHILGIGYHYAF
jgi:hypothetical protein